MNGNCKCYRCGGTIPLNEPILAQQYIVGEEEDYHADCYEKTTAGQMGLHPSKVYGPLEIDYDALS